MRIKKNGKAILLTLLVVILFSLLIIWHDKPGEDLEQSESQQRIQYISHKNVDFELFIKPYARFETVGFFSVGIEGSLTWPRDLFKACYLDPISKRTQFSAITNALPQELEVIRYRSLADLLTILEETELASPGTIAQLDFKSHTMISENPRGISIKLILAVILGIFGLFIVGSIRSKN